MGGEALYNISLIAAFIAGMVALFAPCCISYLLPTYLANVFKEKKRVLFMTLVYSSGIFVVMLPIVLGARALASLFFRMHDQTYIVGGIIMIIVAIFAFLGIKLPMPNIRFGKLGANSDIGSTFVLGLLAGVTSACCAPVLVGVMTLGSLTPSTFQALGVGVAYVLGMVTPLYLASLFIERGNILDKPILKKRFTFITIFGNRYPIFVSNVVAGVIFSLTGVITIILTLMGKLGMDGDESKIIMLVHDVAFRVTDITTRIPGLNVLFALVGLYFVYRVIKSAMNQED